MGIKNCKKCGRIYADDSFALCPICRSDNLDEFKVVKDFLYEYPGADIQTVSEKTGVDTKKILKFLREGKLEIKGDSANFILDCERCGVAITSGRFCNKCIAEMEREFRGVVSKDSTSATRKDSGRDSDRMYIAERRNKR